MNFYRVIFKLFLLLATFPAMASYNTGYMAALFLLGYVVFCLIVALVMLIGLIKKRFQNHNYFGNYLKTVISVSILSYLLSIMEFKSSPNNNDLLTITIIYLLLVFVLTVPAWVQNKRDNKGAE